MPGSEHGAMRFTGAAAEGHTGDHALVAAEIGSVIARCEARGIDKAVVNAVLLAELLPRLVDAYGPLGVAGVLGQLADYIGHSHPDTPRTRQ